MAAKYVDRKVLRCPVCAAEMSLSEIGQRHFECIGCGERLRRATGYLLKLLFVEILATVAIAYALGGPSWLTVIYAAIGFFPISIGVAALFYRVWPPPLEVDTSRRGWPGHITR
jgi:hypothetical protein